MGRQSRAPTRGGGGVDLEMAHFTAADRRRDLDDEAVAVLRLNGQGRAGARPVGPSQPAQGAVDKGLYEQIVVVLLGGCPSAYPARVDFFDRALDRAGGRAAARLPALRFGRRLGAAGVEFPPTDDAGLGTRVIIRARPRSAATRREAARRRTAAAPSPSRRAARARPARRCRRRPRADRGSSPPRPRSNKSQARSRG